MLGILTALKGEIMIPAVRFIIPLFLLWIAGRSFLSGRVNLFRPLLFLFFFLIGIATELLNRKPVPDFNDQEPVVVKGILKSEPVSGNGRIRFELETRWMVSVERTFSGRTVLMTYLSDTAMIRRIETSGHMCLAGVVYRVKNNRNPGAFDYAGYLSRRNCYYRFYPDSIIIYGHRQQESWRIDNLTRSVKRRITESWTGEPDALAILMAVTTGDRSELTTDLKESYSDAGGMHLLAVSGLHIGLIWMVLTRIFFFLSFIPAGKIIRSILVIVILWFYALMAGFTPSVCRSVTMFSLFAVSSALSRGRTSLNILFLSALVLLIMNPRQVLDIGFQLSYLAVTGIITMHPLISGIFHPKYRVIRRVVDLISLSVSAQIATLPLSISTFNQIPVYFLLTNLVAVPLLSCIVGVFVVSTPFFLLRVLEHPFLWILNHLTQLMNRLVTAISSVPGSVAAELHVNTGVMILVYLVVIIFLLYVRYRKISLLIAGLALISGSLILSSSLIVKERGTHRVLVPHFRGGTLLTIQNGIHADHFISCRDAQSCKAIWNYLRSDYFCRIRDSEIHSLDSLGMLHSPYLSAVRLHEGCILIAAKDLRILILDGPKGYRYPQFLQDYPSDLYILQRFGHPREIKSLDFNPGAGIIINGFNLPGLLLNLSGDTVNLFCTEEEGAYIKNY